jgi:hypothetical protein
VSERGLIDLIDTALVIIASALAVDLALVIVASWGWAPLGR